MFISAPAGSFVKKLRPADTFIENILRKRYISMGFCINVSKQIWRTAVWEAVPSFGEPDLILPSGLTAAAEEDISGIPAGVVEIMEGCAGIGGRAFRDRPNLSQIRVPRGLRSGCGRFFDGCAKVFVCGAAGSAAESYRSVHGGCALAEESQTFPVQ